MGMHKEFFYNAIRTTTECEWLAYLGGPMLYDGSLCVNREPDEVEYHSKRKYHSFLEF